MSILTLGTFNCIILCNSSSFHVLNLSSCHPCKQYLFKSTFTCKYFEFAAYSMWYKNSIYQMFPRSTSLPAFHFCPGYETRIVWHNPSSTEELCAENLDIYKATYWLWRMCCGVVRRTSRCQSQVNAPRRLRLGYIHSKTLDSIELKSIEILQGFHLVTKFLHLRWKHQKTGAAVLLSHLAL